MQTQIKFIVSGANSIYGGFSAGDVLRCPENVANHLVAIGVAKFNEKPIGPENVIISNSDFKKPSRKKAKE